MMNTNFERITRKAPAEGFTGRKGAKLNKTQRGGGVKGQFRDLKGDSLINQEKYFSGE